MTREENDKIRKTAKDMIDDYVIYQVDRGWYDRSDIAELLEDFVEKLIDKLSDENVCNNPIGKVSDDTPKKRA